MHIGLLLCIYFTNALIVALVLLWAFLSDRSTANSHVASWAVIFVASAFWFIAVPLSMMEVLRKSWHQRRSLAGKSNPPRYLG